MTTSRARLLRGDSREDSSVDSEQSAGSQPNRAASLVKLPSMPSMYSPESKASSHANASDDDASSHTPSTSSVDYDQLPVSDEIKELFKLIDLYEPVELDLETPLKCFIPSYIPSVGDVDPFIKIPRPDGVPDGLGTVILDEPVPASQSNAAVIELQLRNFSMRSNRNVSVHSISNAAENGEEIDQWIQNVEEIHNAKPPPEVRYRNEMPSVQELMKPWPKEMKDELTDGAHVLPSADIDLSVEEYARLTCTLLGVPVYGDCAVESIHAMFTMFIEMQASNDSMTDTSLLH